MRFKLFFITILLKHFFIFSCKNMRLLLYRFFLFFFWFH